MQAHTCVKLQCPRMSGNCFQGKLLWRELGASAPGVEQSGVLSHCIYFHLVGFDERGHGLRLLIYGQRLPLLRVKQG